MTTAVNTTCDVFIAHALSDSRFAEELGEGLEAVGLTPFHTGMLARGAEWDEAIWHALAESRAMIVIVSPEPPLSSMSVVELGAASVWNKPVFVVLNGPSTTKLPTALRSYPVYPLIRFDEVIRAIQVGFQPLTDEERRILLDNYRKLSTPIDELSQSPNELRTLTTKYNRKVAQHLSGERLLSELFRIQKQGQLLPVQNGE